MLLPLTLYYREYLQLQKAGFATALLELCTGTLNLVSLSLLFAQL